MKEAIHRMNRMRSRTEYQKALAEYTVLPKNISGKRFGSRAEFLRTVLSGIRMEEGLTEYDLQKYVKLSQMRYSRYISSQQAQAITSEVWKGVEKVLYGNGQHLHFKKRADIDTIPGKSNKNGARWYPDCTIRYAGMQLKAVVDSEDPYVQQAMKDSVRYVTIKRRMFPDGYHYYAVLTLSGTAPKKIVAHKTEEIGIDPGMTVMNVCGEESADMFELAPDCSRYNRKIARIQRSIDRKKRVSDPDNFNADGTIKKGHLTWHLSRSCRRCCNILTYLFRKKSAYIRQSHFIQADNIIRTASGIAIEPMEYKALQKKSKVVKRQAAPSEIQKKDGSVQKVYKYKRRKRFGKSLNDRAPSSFLAILEQKAALYNIPVIEIKTAQYKASQYRHDTDAYEKIPLSKRRKTISGAIVLRDLYSAFLIRNTDASGTHPDRHKCADTFPDFLKLQEDLIQRFGSTPRPKCFGF